MDRLAAGRGPAPSFRDHKGPGSSHPPSSLLGKAVTLTEREAEFEPILCTLGSTEGGKQLVYAGSSLSHCY